MFISPPISAWPFLSVRFLTYYYYRATQDVRRSDDDAPLLFPPIIRVEGKYVSCPVLFLRGGIAVLLLSYYYGITAAAAAAAAGGSATVVTGAVEI